MNINLNWQQSLVLFSMGFGGVALWVMCMPEELHLSDYVVVSPYAFGFFAGLTALAIWSRIHAIPKSFSPERRREERSRILGEIQWGFIRVLVIVALFVFAEKSLRFKISTQVLIVLPSGAFVSFAFAPVLKALGTDDE
jgi:hypothetical protein